MEKESKSGPGQLPGNGIIAVVLLAAGVLFVRETPLETTRPAVNEPRLEQRFAFQDVDARLWQDPFGAVGKARADAAKKAPEDARDQERRSHQKLRDEIERRVAAKVADDLARRRAAHPGASPPSPKDQRVEILAVMLPAGPYSENVESRRRTRYAVLAGLNASRLAPADTEHVGYFYPEAFQRTDANGFAEPVPFEWFEPAVDARPRDTDALQPLVLVMWLQSEAFSEQPIARMRHLASQFDLPYLRWQVLGPNGSDGLKAMIDEAAGSRLEAPEMPVRFYSLNATVPDAVLLADWTEKGKAPVTVAEFLAPKNVMLVRTIGDDGSVADSLIAELALRGLRPGKLKPAEGSADDPLSSRQACSQRAAAGALPPSHIALIAEWDTLYGRSLRREFRARHDNEGFCVERFNYVRGLDGYLANGGNAAPASSDGARQAPATKDADRRKDGGFIEVAEGQSQFDYLRRLALQMRDLDQRLRRSSPDGEGLRAIGVLGNDVHDKLLVLQALRPEFPYALFFTTDMDARFLHAREQGWARNLIVASSFGLQLADGLQGGVPPFRSSYQTSAFFSTRLAMDDARRPPKDAVPSDPAKAQPLPQGEIAKWFAVPRIFEIGRTTAFDFKGAWTPAKSAAADAEDCRGLRWARCRDIHASGSARYPMPGTPALAMGFGLLLLTLWVPALLMGVSAARAWAWVRARRPTLAGTLARYALLLLAFAGVQVALPLWLASRWEPFAQWLTRGKPLVAFEGISLWPTEAVRLLILFLCAYLICRGWLALSDNLDRISEQFDSKPTRANLMDEQRRADRLSGPWQRLVGIFTLGATPKATPRDVEAPDTQPAPEHGMQPLALVFWNRHIVQNRLAARLARTFAWVLLALALSLLLMLAIGERRFVPFRGELSLAVHEGLRIPALVMMYFLIFFVVDATVYCVYFVRGLRALREHEANWPASTLELFKRQLQLPRAYLDNWIDLRFIAMRTRVVTRMIYYPFIVISLWLLSKSPAFDHWTLSPATLAPAVAGLAVAMACAIALRLAAEKSRRHALDQVKDALIRVNADHAVAGAPVADATAQQLTLLQARIEALHEGAFAPLWQQPLLKALLLPFATLGSTTLLDYMALANL